MATVAPTLDQASGIPGKVLIYEWGPLTTTNLDGGWLKIPAYTDKSWHVYGTFGAGATVTIQGSNESVDPPVAPVTLEEGDFANPLTFATAAGNDIKQQAEGPVLQVRPLLSGGDGTTSLKVRVCAVAR